MELAHVAIRVRHEIKAKWEAEAEAQGRSLSNYLYYKIEKPEVVAGSPPFHEPIQGTPGKRRRVKLTRA